MKNDLTTLRIIGEIDICSLSMVSSSLNLNTNAVVVRKLLAYLYVLKYYVDLFTSCYSLAMKPWYLMISHRMIRTNTRLIFSSLQKMMEE